MHEDCLDIYIYFVHSFQFDARDDDDKVFIGTDEKHGTTLNEINNFKLNYSGTNSS